MADHPPLPSLRSKYNRSYSISSTTTTTAATATKAHSARLATKTSSVPAPSPEVISTLISSLSSISSPADDFYDVLLPNASSTTVPPSPPKPWSKNSLRDEIITENPKQEAFIHGEDAAGSPVVRTSKPRVSSSPAASQKRASLPLPPVALISRGSERQNETARSIGGISVEARQLPPLSGSNTPNGSRPNSIRSLRFKESKERIRDLEQRSLSRLRHSGDSPPSLTIKTAVDDDEPRSRRDSNRSVSMYATPSQGPIDATSSVISRGLSVPSRDSSKRHSFQGQKRRHPKSKSIREDPEREASEDARHRHSRTASHASDVGASDALERIKILTEKRQANERQELEHKVAAMQGTASPVDSFNGLSPPRSLAPADLMNKENLDPATPNKSRTSISRSMTEPVYGTTPQKKTGRPQSSLADSIDDAIEDYLGNPRLTQKVQDPLTGRTIAFSEVGDPTGSVVFCCVGMGTTRYLTAFYDELAATLKLRLITPDRPGIGESEPYIEGSGTPLGWPDDIRAICVHLGVQRFSVLAHSAGAVYALATALRMPQHIRCRIHLLAPWIPPSQMVAIGIQKDQVPITTLPYSQRLLRSLPTSFLKIANSSLFAVTSSSIASAMPQKQKKHRRRSANDLDASKDKAAFTSSRTSKHFGAGYSDGLAQDAKPDIMDIAASPGRSPSSMSKNDKARETEYEVRLIHAIWDAATTNANPAVDLLVCLERRQQIGFRYADINKEVVIHHGSKDTRVPVENIAWLGGRMRRCEVRVLPGEGHGLMASAKVMSDVLTEISQEWENWNAIIKSGRK